MSLNLDSQLRTLIHQCLDVPQVLQIARDSSIELISVNNKECTREIIDRILSYFLLIDSIYFADNDRVTFDDIRCIDIGHIRNMLHFLDGSRLKLRCEDIIRKAYAAGHEYILTVVVRIGIIIKPIGTGKMQETFT